jgi:hypothetical protein
VRADHASEADVRSAVRHLGPSVATSFEHLPGLRYFLGARLLEVFPSAPRAGAALAVSALAYDGRLGIGITGDGDADGDLRRLADGLDRAFGELSVAAV